MEQKKTIRIFTNIVASGWSARDLETGIGGSEEILIQWCEYLAKDYNITVYMNGEYGTINGVKYISHKHFKPWEFSDIFISFKNFAVFENSINATKLIHWSTDIEDIKDYQREYVDHIITISEFHKKTFKNTKAEYIGLFYDFKRLKKGIKKENAMIYSSSFDRGLEDLLKNYGKTKNELGFDTLYITYGWDFFDKINKNNPNAKQWKDYINELMKQEGIILKGKVSRNELEELYAKSKYWCLPLNNENAELFCINAIKAQAYRCIPVVNCIGGLQTSVNEFIPFKSIIEDHEYNKNIDLEANFKHAKNFDINNIMKLWKTII